MPWQEVDRMSLRVEFVTFARQPGCNVAALCRRFRISRKTGYKWLGRADLADPASCADRSRRPHASPRKTAAATEERVIAARQQYPCWGGRKLRRVLLDAGAISPAASTITVILRRHGLIDPQEALQHAPLQRFERAAPNELLQMDFKGDFALGNGSRCHTLAVLDDHSRFNLVLQACSDQRTETVRQCLIPAFERYGLPSAMLMDNGSPWGDDRDSPYTLLTVWLMRLGIRVLHGRPYHPQTQGKTERFNRTFELEVLRGRSFLDLDETQRVFNPWRDVYNHIRPHEALEMAVPASRYRPSARAYPAQLPPIEYSSSDQVCVVRDHGRFTFHGQQYRVSKAFRGCPIALRPTVADGCWDVYYCRFVIARLDQHSGQLQRAIAATTLP